MKALLALEDGRVFPCESFTGEGEASGEVVFNTSMTGYQEVLTDPSYCGQMVTMTYPLIGSYGVNPTDVESERIQVAAFIVREYEPNYSNFRATGSLADYLADQGVLGVQNLDTRALTRHIRIGGSMRAVISTKELDPDKLVAKAKAVQGMAGQNLAEQASARRPFFWGDDQPDFIEVVDLMDKSAKIWRTGKQHVVAFDFGIKRNIVRSLEGKGFETLVVPAVTDARTIQALNPDGIFLSNGPGDPQPLTHAIKTVGDLLDYRPMFGICLGHQIMGLAMGGKTYKMQFGHHGGNQPVKDLTTGKVIITSQNHGFALAEEALYPKQIEVTHINLNDNSIEGIKHKHLPVFSVQYHPEAAPGPHDAQYLFDEFYELTKRN